MEGRNISQTQKESHLV